MPPSDVTKDDRLINCWSWAKQRTWWLSRCPFPMWQAMFAHPLTNSLGSTWVTWYEMLSGQLLLHCLGELVCRRCLWGWRWGLAGQGAEKVVWLKQVNPTRSTIVTKPEVRCCWHVCLCTAIPVWHRGASVPLGDMGMCFFQWYKRVRGAPQMVFPLSAMLLKDFCISYSGSGAWSAFLPMLDLLFYLLQLCHGDWPLQWRASLGGDVYWE